jgi:Asp-tRNA(Asn)/Glu-tRNA(Gln) amidotransferase A subunit family amidase
MKALRRRVITLTAIAGLAGAPQASLPLGRIGGLPVGLSLFGARQRREAARLRAAAGCRLASAVDLLGHGGLPNR